MTPHFTRHEAQPDPSSVHLPLSLDAIQRYVLDWLRRAGASSEGVGYADFGTAGKPRAVEIYSAPRDGFFATIQLDRRVITAERGDLERVLRGLVPPGQIDAIGPAWQARFYAADRLPDALFHILRDLCQIPEREQISVDEWWS